MSKSSDKKPKSTQKINACSNNMGAQACSNCNKEQTKKVK